MQVNENIHARGAQFAIEGFVANGFEPVLRAFGDNFRQEEEIGAGCSVVIDGKTVVDLWGGWRDGAMTTGWDAHSTVCMMSVAKGITGIAFNMLVDRGLIDIDRPVADYWPEFGQNGKEKILVRWLLDHRAAIPVLTDDPMYPGGMFDREAYVKALEVQTPLWQPGTRAAYHVHNQGYLLGEVMRRVSGLTVGPFLRREIAQPLGAEYWIGGMSAAEQATVAEIMPNMNARLFAAKDVELTADPEWTGEVLRPLAFRQNPDEPWHVTLNKPLWREVEIASGNGHGNARGVARIYGAVVDPGEIDGLTLLSRDGLERMIEEQHNQTELLQERPYHQALGVLLNTPEAVYMGPNPRSFGHHGIGGSIGFGDPDARIGFSYCCNKLHSVGDNGPRARRLIDALYSAL
ncbi:serine hydrolase [Sphingobium lignivorans]|uniref:CubicO group peptidase (Beta-lactamase class C family) n=1 Tax=Sphingobium lignivorans TaxID=2735886 RepID=A0ABR6NF29_9SPHN|nr:CubicO group peptidase (beta-lactamase class C family) [Sphingobium lignivorans]